jgi:anhydro-N-acetylmuramic acid kinase
VRRIVDLLAKEETLVVGLMSGTSADGIDAALVRIRGFGLATEAKVLAFKTVPYPARLREQVLGLGGGLVPDLCRLNFTLGERFADAALELLKGARVAPGEIDLVGSHGQTVHHVPRRPGEVASTLQIGEASVIAERLGVPVVSDFRTRDIAAGGEGAPLSAYVDFLLFRKKGPPRALLNLGGIANVTVVGAEIEEVFAFDTGPANMPLDETMRILTHGRERYDRDGRTAAKGRVDENLLRKLLTHPYLQQPPPKTTGREMFGADFVLPLLRAKGGRTGVDVLATLTAFSAHAVKQAFDEFVAPRAQPTEILVSGGGVHNLTLMGHLRRLFPKEKVLSLADRGIDPDAKEALIFAVLANETVHGVPNNVPGATGARWPTILGKVTP